MYIYLIELTYAGTCTGTLNTKGSVHRHLIPGEPAYQAADAVLVVLKLDVPAAAVMKWWRWRM